MVLSQSEAKICRKFFTPWRDDELSRYFQGCVPYRTPARGYMESLLDRRKIGRHGPSYPPWLMFVGLYKRVFVGLSRNPFYQVTPINIEQAPLNRFIYIYIPF